MLQKTRDAYFERKSIQFRRSLSSEIPILVKQCPQLTDIAPAERWRIEKLFPSLSDMRVMIIGTDVGSTQAVLYLPQTDLAIADFERRKKVMTALREDERLSDFQSYLPLLLGQGIYKNRPYWITTCLPGVSSDTALHGREAIAVMQLAVEVLGQLHLTTARNVTVGAELLDRWVFSPIQVILRSPLAFYHRKSRLLLDRLGAKLAKDLQSKCVVISWVHGDYWPNNVLIAQNHQKITGIIDWDLARPDDLPTLDVVNFLLSACREIQERELGQVIVETHQRGRWENGLQVIWDREVQLLDVNIPDLKNTLLLFWIGHLSSNLKKSRMYSANPLWALKNYQFIMNYLETEAMR